MGLGLPLCHDIMKAHGGALMVDSEPGRGCVFHISLPEAQATVLIVDDQEAARMEIVEQMQDMAANIIEAANGKEALDRLAEIVPHLVITDIAMPVMDGLELLQFIRKNPAMESVPVVVMTSNAGVDTREEAFRLGASDFVTKPIVAAEFIPRVKRFVEG